MRIYCGFILLLTITFFPVISFAKSDNVTTPLLPDLNIGKTAYKNKDYLTAYQNWLPIAKAGFPKAKTELGKLYLRGLGVPKNPKLAYGLFKSAYKNGDTRALIEIGRLYEKGQGVPVNILEAKNWYMRASQEGNPRGDYLIGELYQNKKLSPYYGAPTPPTSKDFIKESLNEFRKKHFVHAEALADMYRLGLHVQQDFKKALIFMLIAEKYGSSTAERKARLLETKVNYDDFVEAPRLAANIYNGQKYGKKIIKEYIQLKEPEETFYQKAEREAEAAYYFQKSADNGYTKAKQKLTEISNKNINKKTKEQIASLEIKKKYRIKGTVKTQYDFDNNLDLGKNGSKEETATVIDSLLGIYLYPADNVTTYIEGRAFASKGNASSNLDDYNDEISQSFFEMRQSWVEFDKIINPMISLKVGRQRFYEPITIFWNRDLDAVRLSLNSTLNNGFIAIGENLSSYRTGTNNKFQGDEKDRFRVLGEFEHSINYNNKISTRFLYENDHSGFIKTGNIINEAARDDRDYNLLWAGVRANGEINNKKYKNIKKIIYRSDLMSVLGKEKLNPSSPISGTNNRTITSEQTRNVFGWGFDGSVTALLDNKMQTALTLKYAYGSGDNSSNGSGTNNAFRQTGLHGNSSRSPFVLTNETTRNYGEVFRPELSNIHILNAGINFPILNYSDMGFDYFRYWLDKTETGLLYSSITAPVNGIDSYLGQEMNASANIYIGKELGLVNKIANQTTFRVRLGMFRSGSAFGNNDESAYRGTGELRFKF